jgi:hypothetical protein
MMVYDPKLERPTLTLQPEGSKYRFDPGELAKAMASLPDDEADDLRAERAAILEYCAGFPRAEAERRAGVAQRQDRKAG